MSEISYFWSGSTVGDAINAPYDHLEFTRTYSKLFASDAAGYVVPGYANSLSVQASSPAAATVDVATGCAFVKGFVYENNALKTLAIAANASGNPRIDRVVLRISFSAQTVTAVILQGAAAASPAFPALTQTYGTTWEISLGYIWVANGFATIANTEIFDERQFLETALTANANNLSKNLISNSEFFAFPGIGAAGPPWGWELTPAASGAFVSIAKAPQMVRGRVCYLESNPGNPILSQTFQVQPSTTYALRGILRAQSAGSTASVTVTTNSASPATKSNVIRATAVYRDIQIIYTTEADATTMTLSIAPDGPPSATCYIGQWLAVRGYFPGPYRECPEIIYSGGSTQATALTDAAWNATAKSSGTTAVDLASTFGSRMLAGVKAVYVVAVINDSGSAGSTTAELRINSSGTAYFFRLFCAGLANDAKSGLSGWVPLPKLGTSLSFVVVASGAGTLDAEVNISGIEV